MAADERFKKRDQPGADQPTAPDPTAKRRVVCTSPNPGKVIDGVAFARVKLGDAHACISEHVADDAAYKHFLAVPGFDAWTGNEDRDARTIEDGLEASRKAPGSSGSALADYERRLKEQQSSSRSLAMQVKQLSDALTAEKKKNADLQLQVDALRGARAQVEAPVAARVATV